MRTPSPTDTAQSLKGVLRHGQRLGFHERTAFFHAYMAAARHAHTDGLHLRVVLSPMDREVIVRDYDGVERPMLMFGSNNYLGLANHPYVKGRVRAALDAFGAGVGGPPLLNGYSALHCELEARLAAWEGQEDALLYGSGYGANVGLITALPTRHDAVVYDAHSHASFYDGLAMGRVPGVAFPHNDVAALEKHLAAFDGRPGDRFVGVEGVYSMNGDLAPLDAVVAACKRHGATLLLDDAHGTGVTGGGRGTAHHFGVAGDVDVVLGTFSKAFGVAGGFVAASRAVVEYLRLFSRPYVFSASPPPTTIAAVLAGLDLLEREPDLHGRLAANAEHLAGGLRRLGFDAHAGSAVFPLPVPLAMNVRAAAHHFHRMGIFVNHIEYPAVRPGEQRFRLSVSAAHTRADLDRLLTAVEKVWATLAPRGESSHRAPAPVAEADDTFGGYG